MKDELADVDFVVDEMVGQPEQITALADRLAECDGILGIHLTLHTLPAMTALLDLGRPTMIFSPPYAGHEWFYLSDIRRKKQGENMDCMLTTDYSQLAVAIRPFRAIHHLREAKVLNLTTEMSREYVDQVTQQVRHRDRAGSVGPDARLVRRGERSGGPGRGGPLDQGGRGGGRAVAGGDLQVVQAGPGLWEADGRGERHGADRGLLRQHVA